jgi:hypothetical protein
MNQLQIEMLTAIVGQLKSEGVPRKEICRALVLLAVQIYIQEHFQYTSAEAQRAAAVWVGDLAADIARHADLRLPSAAVN